MKNYNFDEFLVRMTKLDTLDDVIATAVGIADRAERHQKQSTREYVEKIGQFLFFMRHIREDAEGDFERTPRPSGISDSNFEKYRDVVEILVNKKELPPKALDIFH